MTESHLPPSASGLALPMHVDPATRENRLRDLHPGWLASVMGTGILSVATYLNPGEVGVLAETAHGLGTTLAVLAYILGLVLVGAYALRWTLHTAAAAADLRHPTFGAMHATLPGALLVLAVMTSAVGPSLLPDSAVAALTAALAASGGILALVLSVAFATGQFTGTPPATSVNGGWFIPPVVTVIIAMAVAPLVAQTSPGGARSLLALGYACTGMGFLLFLLVLGQLYDRLVLHPLPPALLAPTLWIGLGPVGVSILAPLALARAGQNVFGVAAPTVTLFSQLFGTAVWGFGLWWLAIALTLLIRYLRAGSFPFHLGWWAFTFPLGAFTTATLTLARAWQTPVLEGVGAVLYLMLVGFWVAVAARTIAALRTGRIWGR